MEKLIIKGAREHNLKNIDLELPRDKLIVISGLSGSGKSSLAFDTIFAEGQRRYVESLSAYARQFLGRMDKPDVDYRGAFPRYFHRAENHAQESPVDGRHGYRDIRLSPPPLCQDRDTPLSFLRQGDQGTERRPDSGGDSLLAFGLETADSRTGSAGNEGRA
jgi:hypothetical protein